MRRLTTAVLVVLLAMTVTVLSTYLVVTQFVLGPELLGGDE